MQSKSLQELIRKIFSDENTKARFMENPESVMSQYSLTDKERSAMLHTYSRVGLATSVNSTQLESEVGPLDVWH